MRGRYVLIAVLALAAPAVAAPGDMSVAAYLAKAESLRGQGMAGLVSDDLGKLREEARGAGRAYRARLAADKAAGKPPRACPPAQIGLQPDQLLAHLRTYPVARRSRITLNTAMAEWIEKTYPCR